MRRLLVARPNETISLADALVSTAAVTLIALALRPAYARAPATVTTYDAHAFWSLDLAIDWVYCGKYMAHSPTYDLTHYLIAHHADVRAMPLPTVLERVAGSKEKYCAQVTEPFLNNENSVFYIDAALMWMNPNISLDGLAARLTWIRVASLVFVVFALISIGASLVFALLALLLGLEIASLSGPTHIYSLYPFLLPFLGIYVSLLGLTLKRGWHRTNWQLAVAALGIGLFGGFFYNLRSSYLPMILGIYLVFVAVIVLEGPAVRLRQALAARWQRGGIALAGLATGLGLFYLVFTYPIIRAGGAYNFTNHVVAHSLVISLALPPNALSQREGIRYEDLVGFDIARRVDPDVPYLSPSYERALFAYYGRLWRQYPREMFDIYLTKWRLSTTESVRFVDANMSLLAQRLFAPMRLVRSGIAFTLMFVTIAAAGFYAAIRFSPGAGMLVAALGVAGFWITVESAIIMPSFFLQFHNAQLFMLFAINLLVIQLLVDAAWRLTRQGTA